MAERWRLRRRSHTTTRRLSVRQALVIGGFQMFALIPGLSRSGLAMAGGLGQSLELEDAAQFAFLLGTPIIGAAGLLVPAVVGGLAAGAAAWLSTRFLLRFFQHGSLRGLFWVSLTTGVASLVLVH